MDPPCAAAPQPGRTDVAAEPPVRNPALPPSFGHDASADARARGAVSAVPTSTRESIMGKRSSRRAAAQEQAKVRALYPRDTDWHPLDQEQGRDKSYRRNVRPMSAGQEELLAAIDDYNLVVAAGPAGTGKTYLAIAKAVEAMEAGRIERIVLTRPAVEAGETLGFLPGGVETKLQPYLRPLYDALTDRLGNKRVKMMLGEGMIEIAPVAFMRGRTLNNAFIVIDEAQNCTYSQIKMLLTRLGWNSTMILTGDPDQSDLLPGMSGLGDIARRLETLEDVAVVYLEDKDIVRHPLVASMLTVI
jgi:phosphate starvation-inducible PhoH-like protein